MPASLRRFEFALSSSVLLGITVFVLAFSTRAGLSGNDVLLGLLLASNAVLAPFVSRKRSPLARWLLLAMFVGGLPFFLSNLLIYLTMGLVGILSSMQLALHALAMGLLCTPSSRSWFVCERQ